MDPRFCLSIAHLHHNFLTLRITSVYEVPSTITTLFYIHSALYGAVTKSNLSLALRAVYVSAQRPLESTYKFIDRFPSHSVIVILLYMLFRIFISSSYDLSTSYHPLLFLHVICITSCVHFRERHAQCKTHLATPIRPYLST